MRTPNRGAAHNDLSWSAKKSQGNDSGQFTLPNVNRMQAGVRSVNRMQLEDNEDSIKSDSNDSSKWFSQTSSRIGIES